MALMLYVAIDGDDDNGGSSAGAAKAGGSNAVTNGTATVQLPGGTDLSGVQVDDTIRIGSRTDGLNGTSVFKIAAVDDSADTVSVTPTPASGSGQDWAIGGAWATPQRAMNAVSAGDHVWVKAGTYTDDTDGDGICAKIKQVGTCSAPIIFEAYKETPGDADAFRLAHPELSPSDPQLDAYRAVIDGSAESLTAGIDEGGKPFGTRLFYIFKHLKACNCAFGFRLASNLKLDVIMRHCRATQNTLGVALPVSSCAEGCSFDGNSGDALHVGSSSLICACEIRNNGGGGVDLDGNNVVGFGNLIYGNADGAVIAGGVENQPSWWINNTFVGDGDQDGDAALVVLGQDIVGLLNNVICGFDTGVYSWSDLGFACVRNNLFAQNNADRYQFPTGLGDQSAAAAGFLDEGGDDYRLKLSSAARGAGVPPHIDVGSLQRKEVGTHSPTNVGVQR